LFVNVDDVPSGVACNNLRSFDGEARATLLVNAPNVKPNGMNAVGLKVKAHSPFGREPDSTLSTTDEKRLSAKHLLLTSKYLLKQFFEALPLGARHCPDGVWSAQCGFTSFAM